MTTTTMTEQGASPMTTIREILNMSGYTDHPSHIVNHRFIVGPDGCGVGHYTAKHVLGLINKEQAR